MKRKSKVTAVVLAGGFGTRLNPITDTKPKPLVKILDTTVLENILCSIEKTEVSKTVVSTHYKPEKIGELCRENFPGVSLKKEYAPLGTAGGVKYCMEHDDETVLVVSGDAVFDFSLQRVIDFHFQNECDVTIVSARKENPTHYGVVIKDDENNVIGFCEKPSWKNVRSDLVNTGIYVLDKKALEQIPDNVQYDFSQNLFPKLMREGYNIKTFVADSFWCDVGTLDEYYECNANAAKNKLSCIQNMGYSYKTLEEKGIHAQEGVYVSQKAVIGKNVRLSSASIVCNAANIGDSCDISRSVIGENSRIGKGSSINGAIIGEGCSIGENCIIPEGCVLGDECRISDGSVLKKHEKIKPCSVVFGKESVKVLFSKYENVFVDDGVCVFELSCARNNLAEFAQAVYKAFCADGNMQVSAAVMCENNCVSMKNVFLSGLQNKNVHTFDCGIGNNAMCAFLTERLGAGVGIFLEIDGGNLKISLYNENGKPIDDICERKISKMFAAMNEETDEMFDCACQQCEAVNVPAYEIYTSCLVTFMSSTLLGRTLSGMSVSVMSKDKNQNASVNVLERVLCKMSAKLEKEWDRDVLQIILNHDGTRAAIKYNNTILDHEHICAVILKNREVLGIEKIYVSENAPMILRNMSGIHDKSSFSRYGDFICFDGALAALAFVSILQLRAESVDKVCSEIPLFEIYVDEYLGDINRGHTMERLSRMYHDSGSGAGDGIRLSLADGNVTVIPGRARGFKIISESVSVEAARELSVRIGDIIKGKE